MSRNDEKALHEMMLKGKHVLIVEHDGAYHLLDENRKVVKSINGYVPSIMCPEGDGYGDYVIMKIDGTGKIARWTPDLSDFQKADED